MPTKRPAKPRVLLIGASGTLGRAVAKELAPRFTVLGASRGGKMKVDITDPASIRRLFEQVGQVDAIACAAGKVHFGPLAKMGAEEFAVGLKDKLMGQVHLAQIGAPHLADGGSITLITGILAEHPIRE